MLSKYNIFSKKSIKVPKIIRLSLVFLKIMEYVVHVIRKINVAPIKMQR